jgi:hypothetical protein
MSILNIPIPESIREQVESLAREDGVSVEAFVASVLSQRAAVAIADSYIRRRASRGSAEQMIQILEQAPQVEPDPHDRIDLESEQTGAGQPATRPVDEPEGGDQPQPEAEGRSR